MSIIRELVTKISFQVDKKGIEQFNRSIIGFKTKFALAATAVSGFTLGVVKAVKGVTDSVLDTNELARSLGVSEDRLIGMQRAANRFRISTAEFNSGFTHLNDLIRQAQQGSGELITQSKLGGFEIRNANGEILQAIDLYDVIIQRLAKIENIRDREIQAEKLLGNKRFAQVAIEPNRFKQLSEELKPTVEELQAAVKASQEFDTALTTLIQTADSFKLKFFTPVINGLSEVIKFFNQAFEAISRYKQGLEIESTPFIQNARKGFKEEARFLDSIFDSILLKILSPDGTTNRNNSVRINTVNVNVTSDIAAENRAFGEQNIRAMFESAIRQVWEETGNNFPVTE